MKYRKLGTTDIEVSTICLGSMTWGEQNTEQQGWQQLDYAVSEGVNFIDVAEMYPVPPRPETQGLTEACLGNWLEKRGRRDDLIIASKVTGRSDANDGVGHIRNGARLNAEHIDQAIDDSLRRLKTDYIDLYQVHWPERRTNFFGKLGYQQSEPHKPTAEQDGVAIQETLEALAVHVKSGKIRHIGISNETPWGAAEYLRCADKYGLPRSMSIQNPYNLLNRTYEVGLSELSIREDMGMLAYSPLAFGVLSGKYLNNAKPEGARLTLFERFTRYTNDMAQQATAAYVDLAKANNISPSQMALAFILQRPEVTSCIIGATNMEQLKENVTSVDLILSDEILAEIESIHDRWTNPSP